MNPNGAKNFFFVPFFYLPTSALFNLRVSVVLEELWRMLNLLQRVETRHTASSLYSR